jgi:hypothetical protein
VMWNTMGLSFVFATFTGLGELAAAVLLMFRRTVTLGALVVVAVCSIITLMDILDNRAGITWESLQVVLSGLVLVIPDWRRLRALYLRNETVGALVEPPLIRVKWRPWLKLGLTAYAFQHAIGIRKLDVYWKETHSLSGLFQVDEEIRNGQRVVPRFDDTTQWAYVGLGNPYTVGSLRGTVDLPEALFVIRRDGAVFEGYRIAVDTSRRTMAVDTSQSPEAQAGAPRLRHAVVVTPFEYREFGKDTLELEAVLDHDTVLLRMHRDRIQQSVLFGSPRLVKGRFSTGTNLQ